MSLVTPESLRERLERLVESGVTLRAIANRTHVHDNALSSFRRGSAWGKDRMGRLDAALQEFEQQLRPTPTFDVASEAE